MNTCEQCSEQVSEEKAFCPNCGHSMTPERRRTVEMSEEMGETMLGYNAPLKNPSTFKPAPPPVKAEPIVASPAPAIAHRAPSVMAYNVPQNTAQRGADDGHRKLPLILGVAAALFILSILLVVILYVTGKI